MKSIDVTREGQPRLSEIKQEVFPFLEQLEREAEQVQNLASRKKSQEDYERRKYFL